MPIVTITRGALQRTFSFTEALAERLKARTVSREDVIDHGRKYGLDQFELSKLGLLEKRPPVIWDRWRTDRKQYLTVYKAALMDLIVEGNVIYVGNIGRFVLSDIPRLLRIRLDATKKYRVKHRMLDSGDTQDQAVEFVDRIDRQREEWVKFLYNVDYYEHANYDLILNIETLSVQSMVDIAAAASALSEFHQDEKTQRVVRDIHLQTHVLVALVSSPRTRAIELGVTADSAVGLITIRGTQPMVGIEIWTKDITEAAMTVQGVKEVRFDNES